MKNIRKFKGIVKVFGKDKQTLLSETKIGESLAIGCELEKDEIGLYIASLDVSASCGFKFDEWDNFVQGVNEANKNLKEIYKK
ncbi:hypothetical protein ES695_02000 [Candidatus Atribacteria bacterium 1244-E10-H5-B2]|nr:MAG: hypothetical protein ES695_02000 [Candidatus Atribacteria bacterium 1244-E10-H5-B2]